MSRGHRHLTLGRQIVYRLTHQVPKQIEHLCDLININDETCINNMQMDKNTFARLCFLLENVDGLVHIRHIQISEQVAIFLIVLAYHKKNQVVNNRFTIVLTKLLRLHILLVNPEPVQDGCTNERWKYLCFVMYMVCLGALDGTYIKVRVHQTDKARYRNKKGEFVVNGVSVYDENIKFVYILSGWEGSATDSRVLRDAINRPNGLRVPSGNYYLCDCGYANGVGFLVPYRGVRYHLDE
ncbi:hypothetical protein Pfo_015353 [Paulownia fortunei]|nr:hypothetical protein Pfo_015353 [Paulownia fortunei]